MMWRRVLVASGLLAGCGIYFGDNSTPNAGPGAPGASARTLVAGSRSTCARIGSTWSCWGANFAGQLTEMAGWDPRPKLTPEPIMPSGALLAMGDAHSCSIESGGVVTCWGSNWNGQLGRETDAPSVNAEHNAPAAVDGLPAKGLAVATGGRHTCAILADHSLWCWGDNTHGQLGVDVSSGPTPRRVLDGVDAVALGDAHSCAVLHDGSVDCWGANTHGQLGDGTQTDQPAPTAIGVHAVALALGGNHTCALDGSGNVTCWGANDRGQLGDGTTTENTAATMPVVTNAVDLVAYGDHTCAVLADGTGSCWGANDNGELGDGTLVQRTQPVTIAAGAVSEIALGVSHACARRTDSTLACWGRDSLGELGDGPTPNATPQPTALPAGASGLAVGAFHACAIVGSDARVYCWGDDHHGQLGDGASALASALPVDTGLTQAIAIAAGVAHTCALRADHSVWCWGDDVDGELGDGMHAQQARPVMTGMSAVAVAAGDGFTCTITPSSQLQCFGRDDLGQLATGATMPALASISASYSHACALTTAGAALCWGANEHGEDGNGGVGALAAPAGPAGTYVQIAAGGNHTCAVASSGVDADCWGGDYLDQLGDFRVADRYTPARASAGLPVGTYVVGAGRAHTCVSSSDNGNGYGWVECFGEDIDGECAVGTRRINPPMGVALGAFATQLGGGDAFSCALVGQSVECWGDNSRGQLGLGTFSRSTSPLDLVIAN